IQEEANCSPVAAVRKVAFMIEGGIEAPIYSHPLPPVRRVVVDHEIKQGSLRADQFIAFTSDLRPQRDEVLFIMTLSHSGILRAGQYGAGIRAGKSDAALQNEWPLKVIGAANLAARRGVYRL